jgi:hypothetical protein
MPTQVTAIIVGGLGSYYFRKFPTIFLSARGDPANTLLNTTLALVIEVHTNPSYPCLAVARTELCLYTPTLQF